MAHSHLFIGLMSGTSLDGVDGILASFSTDAHTHIQSLGSAYIPFSDTLRSDLMRLQTASENELHHEAMAANTLAHTYAECVRHLLKEAAIASAAVRAVGVHGQTIRHRPDLGYTRQTNNPSLLAELTGIDVIADFRSRDIAAGGQGAPLVPAFHQSVFGNTNETRVVVNIGGIANISVLKKDGTVLGFDTGPGNVLMDAWIGQMQQLPYDVDGAWAAQGTCIDALLALLLKEPYLTLPPPKSTGRDLFHPAWLAEKLTQFPTAAPGDVQATLAAFTAITIAEAIAKHAPEVHAVYVCGGGAFNTYLMQQLTNALQARGCAASVESTAALGVSPNHVEALAFAWLAHRHVERESGNIPGATGAKGPRILGALYPA